MLKKKSEMPNPSSAMQLATLVAAVAVTSCDEAHAAVSRERQLTLNHFVSVTVNKK